jgi:hypothetical protein
MTPENVKGKLIEVLKEIEKDSGYEGTPIQGTTSPLEELGWFDSYLWPIAISMLATALNVNIPNDANIFFSEDGKRLLTIDESADVVYNIISKGEN